MRTGWWWLVSNILSYHTTIKETSLSVPGILFQKGPTNVAATTLRILLQNTNLFVFVISQSNKKVLWHFVKFKNHIYNKTCNNLSIRKLFFFWEVVVRFWLLCVTKVRFLFFCRVWSYCGDLQFFFWFEDSRHHAISEFFQVSYFFFCSCIS